MVATMDLKTTKYDNFSDDSSEFIPDNGKRLGMGCAENIEIQKIPRIERGWPGNGNEDCGRRAQENFGICYKSNVVGRGVAEVDTDKDSVESLVARILNKYNNNSGTPGGSATKGQSQVCRIPTNETSGIGEVFGNDNIEIVEEDSAYSIDMKLSSDNPKAKAFPGRKNYKSTLETSPKKSPQNSNPRIFKSDSKRGKIGGGTKKSSKRSDKNYSSSKKGSDCSQKNARGRGSNILTPKNLHSKTML